MRLPWQQMTFDGKRRAKSFGLLLGIGGHAGVGFVSDLWEAALDLSPDGDFSGAFGDPGVLVAHAGGNPRGCSAEPARVVELLQRVGLVATLPTLRVRGLDRYRAAWLKNRKNKTTRAEPDANPTPKTETETEIKTETETSTALAPASRSRAAKKPPDVRWKPTIEAIEAAFKGVTGQAYRFGGAKDGSALKRLLAVETPEEILRRWGVGLKVEGWRHTATVAQLGAKWNDLAKAGGAAKTSAPVRVEDQGWDTEGPITARVVENF